MTSALRSSSATRQRVPGPLSAAHARTKAAASGVAPPGSTYRQSAAMT